MNFLASAAGRWLVLVLVINSALAAGFFAGREWEQAEQLELRFEELDQFHNALLEKTEVWRRKNDAIAALLNREQVSRAQDQRRFERELSNVPRETIVEISCPRGTRITAGAQGNAEPAGTQTEPASPAPVAVARFSPVGCKLWNDALAAGATAAERAGWLAAANPCADSP